MKKQTGQITYSPSNVGAWSRGFKYERPLLRVLTTGWNVGGATLYDGA
jgi:hypothetical protein